MQEIRLSVIIPAYNEGKRLPKTLREIDKYLREQSFEYEILVVDDGSKDNTVEVAKSLLSEIKNLKVTGYKENQGKGYAVRFGLLEAKGQYRLFTDADNSTSIEYIERMWPQFEAGYDIVLGSRNVKGAILSPPQPWIRKVVLGGGFKLFRKIVLGLWSIEDTQCGFKGFTKKVVESVLLKCKINRFAFDPEILVLAQKKGFKIKEVPVTWKDDPESKVKFKSIFKMAIDLLKIKWNLITKKYD
jgi:dolichyl-phosphate beta-glucosyltransferase